MGRVSFFGGKVGMTEPGSLPAGYTKLSYIQSGGTQYINTGFVPNQDTTVVMDCDSSLGATVGAFFGGRVSYASRDFSFWNYSASSWLTNYNGTSTEISGSTSGRHLIEKRKNQTFVDGVLKTTATYASFTAPVPLYLCAANENGTPDGRNFSGKVYSCQVYDNGTKVRDFTPCISPSGAIGLFDLVEGKFYGNAGAGVFIGSEVA